MPALFVSYGNNAFFYIKELNQFQLLSYHHSLDDFISVIFAVWNGDNQSTVCKQNVNLFSGDETVCHVSPIDVEALCFRFPGMNASFIEE